MTDITVTITDTENKCLEYAAYSVQDWADNALTNRAREAQEEIIAILVAYCNENNIQLATGSDAQVTQAFDLELVKTAAQREAEYQAMLEAQAE